jgi:hypothetical protein
LDDENGLKLLPCVFWDNILCSYRKYVTFGVMARCSKCPEYRRFEAVMEKEDEEEARFVEEVQKHPDRYLRGELR